MSLWILDTDTISLLRTGNARVRQRVAEHTPEEVATTIITVEEQLTGWYTLLRRATRTDELSSAYEQLAESVEFYGEVRVLRFTPGAASHFNELRRMKIRAGTLDLRIASIALDYKGILVTRNTQDFERVPGLVLEDWALPLRE